MTQLTHNDSGALPDGTASNNLHRQPPMITDKAAGGSMNQQKNLSLGLHFPGRYVFSCLFCLILLLTGTALNAEPPPGLTGATVTVDVSEHFTVPAIVTTEQPEELCAWAMSNNCGPTGTGGWHWGGADSCPMGVAAQYLTNVHGEFETLDPETQKALGRVNALCLGASIGAASRRVRPVVANPAVAAICVSTGVGAAAQPMLLHCSGTCVNTCAGSEFDSCPFSSEGECMAEGCGEGMACTVLSGGGTGNQCWNCRSYKKSCEFDTVTECFDTCPDAGQNCKKQVSPEGETCFICDAQRGAEAPVEPTPPDDPVPDPNPDPPIPPPNPGIPDGPGGPGGGGVCPVGARCGHGGTGRWVLIGGDCLCENVFTTPGVDPSFCSELAVESQNECPPECLGRCVIQDY